MPEEVSKTSDELNYYDKKVFLDSASVFIVDDDFSLDSIDIASIASNCIGLTQGGADFKAKPDIKELKFDGSNGRPIAGTKRIAKWDVTLEVNAIELLDNTFTLSLLEKKVDEHNKFTEYVPIEGVIGDKFYKNVLLVGKTTDGKDAVILVRNAINTEGFNLKTEDEKEGICKLKLEGNYTLNKDFSTKELPFVIRTFN